MKYFVGTELGVANLLQRHFDWVSNSLWYEEIPNARDPSKTLFVMGGQDAIINATVCMTFSLCCRIWVLIVLRSALNATSPRTASAKTYATTPTRSMDRLS